MPSAAAIEFREPSGERERVLHPGVLLYSGTCSGLAAAVGGLLAFGVGLAVLTFYPPPGVPKAPPGAAWQIFGLLSILLPLATDRLVLGWRCTMAALEPQAFECRQALATIG